MSALAPLSTCDENISQNQGGKAKDTRMTILKQKGQGTYLGPGHPTVNSPGKSHALHLITDVQYMISLSLLLFTLFSP